MASAICAPNSRSDYRINVHFSSYLVNYHDIRWYEVKLSDVIIINARYLLRLARYIFQYMMIRSWYAKSKLSDVIIINARYLLKLARYIFQWYDDTMVRSEIKWRNYYKCALFIKDAMRLNVCWISIKIIRNVDSFFWKRVLDLL